MGNNLFSQGGGGELAQWTTGTGNNGHYYEVVAAPEGVNWNDANAAAIEAGGHLATISSAEENALVFSLIDDDPLWQYLFSRSFGPWIGGVQPAESPEPAGNWQWVSGETFLYEAWGNNEPNNSGAEDRIQFFNDPTPALEPGPLWNDVRSNASALGFVIEYDALPYLSSDQVAVDPQLSPLQDNGGPTWTHTLSLGSPAINAITPVNIANTGTASQSSDYNAAITAYKAIDGNLNTITHTARFDVDPWWEIDLGSSQMIDTIVLHNRVNCCASRLRDITVQILGAADNVVFTSPLLNPENILGEGVLNAGPATLTVDVVMLAGSVVEGQKIRVIRTSDPDLSGSGGVGNADEPDVLSLAEVEVITDQGTDQRGERRLQRGGIDIGAFELGDLPDDSNAADLTGNGSVDFQDLTILLANWGQNVSAAEGNLVDAATTPVNFEDLTVLLAAWTGPGPAGAPGPQAVAATGSRVASVSTQETTTAKARLAISDHFDRLGRRDDLRSRSAGRRTERSISPDDSLRRLQAAAIDRAMSELAGDGRIGRRSRR